MLYDVIILGSGPAGFTASIYAQRAGWKTLIIGGIKWGGQLMLTTLVENFPGFPEGIQGPDLMMNMRKQVERLGVEVVSDDFSKVDFGSKPFKVEAGGKIYEGKTIIISTGADSIWLNVPGELPLRGKGISTCAICDGFFFRNRDVIVVGGGDSAMEDASVLAKVAKTVTVVHRRDTFRASYASQQMMFEHPNVRVLWNSEITEVIGSGKLERVVLNSKVKSPSKISDEILQGKQKSKVQVKSQKLETEMDTEELKKLFGDIKVRDEKGGELFWEMPIGGVFVAIGHKPNTDKFTGIKLDPKGYIVREETKGEDGLLKYWSSTNVAGVFVAGDVNDYRYRQAVTASGYGAMAGLDADKWLMEQGE